MKEITVPIEEHKEDIAEQEIPEDDVDVTSKNEEKEEKYNYSFKGDKHNIIDGHLKDEDLETLANKKVFPPGYSKSSHHRCRFTSRWVQYSGSDGLGYAYGGADLLNYDPTTKNRFIRRVFIILLIMLIIVCVFNFASAKSSLQAFFKEDSSILIVVSVSVVMIALNCFMAYSECTRSPPFTYICLLLTLVGTCIVSGFFSGRYNTLLILYAYVTMVFVAIGMIIIANTSYDFTHWTLHIIGVCIAIPFTLAFFLIAYLRTIEHLRPAYPVYVLIIMIFGTLINVLIMTIMLRIILGSQAVEILEDDYTLGAFYLFTSIFDIYIKFVQLTCLSREDDEE